MTYSIFFTVREICKKATQGRAIWHERAAGLCQNCLSSSVLFAYSRSNCVLLCIVSDVVCGMKKSKSFFQWRPLPDEGLNEDNESYPWFMVRMIFFNASVFIATSGAAIHSLLPF